MDEGERFERYYRQARAGLARMMVRRYFADLIAAGHGTEDQFVEAYLRLADRHPNMALEWVAETLRHGYLQWHSKRQRNGHATPRPTITDLGAP